MNCRLPEVGDKHILMAYVQEHVENGEKSISASMGLNSTDYAAWLERIQHNASVGDEAWGRSLLYLCFDQMKLVGLLSIRYELPQELKNQYGDIGYGVRPSERNKGYATRMLQYGLEVCKEKGMDQVILGCYQENGASVRLIEKSGGVLINENENRTEGRKSLYYRIGL